MCVKLRGMEFVTLHDLSRELNVPARVVRYRFHQLRESGKLLEGEDFRRDDFVDEQHFTWKINPLSYMRETRKSVAPPPGSLHLEELGGPSGNQSGNDSVNHSSIVVNQPVIQNPGAGNQGASFGNQPGEDPGIKSHDPSLEREVIDLLKEQVRTKDQQIKTKDEQIEILSEQLKGTTELNIKLVGQNVHQAERIHELLQLAPGWQHASKVDTNPGNKKEDFVDQVVNQDADVGNDFGNSFGSDHPGDLNHQGDDVSGGASPEKSSVAA